MERLEQFFSTNFLAPHGYCFLWLPEIVWLHVFADALIAIAYFSIPLALWHFIKRRPDMPFRSIFLLFASFITLCGLTHIMGIVVLWYPAYGYEGLLMLLTGIISAMTAVVVWKILPVAVTLPSPAQYKKINEELRNAYSEIEKKVEERTDELIKANHKLEEKSQKLIEANEAKKLFIANISHEIRTPLNAIVVISDKLFHNTLPEDKQQDAMESLYDSSVMLKDIISNVLDFSKIEAGSMAIEPKPFDFNHIIEELQAIANVQALEKGIHFRVVGNNQEFPILVGDPVRIKQILLNLITNAIKFTESGGVVVSIEAVQHDKSSTLNIAVKDTGIGIAPEDQKRIFDNFVQGSVQQLSGTGLGLAISKQLAEKMGGKLTLSSKPGQGSEFSLSLTLPVEEPAAKETNDVDKKPAGAFANSSHRLLVVEDNPHNILVAQLLLGELGYTFDIATSGQEALSLCNTHDYQLILMDIRLQDMSGYDVTEHIREREKRAGAARTPIIAMTAFATNEEKEKCFAAGMDDFSTKPIDMNAIPALLEKWLPA